MKKFTEIKALCNFDKISSDVAEQISLLIDEHMKENDHLLGNKSFDVSIQNIYKWIFKLTWEITYSLHSPNFNTNDYSQSLSEYVGEDMGVFNLLKNLTEGTTYNLCRSCERENLFTAEYLFADVLLMYHYISTYDEHEKSENPYQHFETLPFVNNENIQTIINNIEKMKKSLIFPVEFEYCSFSQREGKKQCANCNKSDPCEAVKDETFDNCDCINSFVAPFLINIAMEWDSCCWNNAGKKQADSLVMPNNLTKYCPCKSDSINIEDHFNSLLLYEDYTSANLATFLFKKLYIDTPMKETAAEKENDRLQIILQTLFMNFNDRNEDNEVDGNLISSLFALPNVVGRFKIAGKIVDDCIADIKNSTNIGAYASYFCKEYIDRYISEYYSLIADYMRLSDIIIDYIDYNYNLSLISHKIAALQNILQEQKTDETLTSISKFVYLDAHGDDKKLRKRYSPFSQIYAYGEKGIKFKERQWKILLENSNQHTNSLNHQFVILLNSVPKKVYANISAFFIPCHFTLIESINNKSIGYDHTVACVVVTDLTGRKSIFSLSTYDSDKLDYLWNENIHVLLKIGIEDILTYDIESDKNFIEKLIQSYPNINASNQYSKNPILKTVLKKATNNSEISKLITRICSKPIKGNVLYPCKTLFEEVSKQYIKKANTTELNFCNEDIINTFKEAFENRVITDCVSAKVSRYQITIHQ